MSAEYFEAMFARWKENPESVDASWRAFFAGFELGLDPSGIWAGRENLGREAQAIGNLGRDVQATGILEQDAQATRVFPTSAGADGRCAEAERAAAEQAAAQSSVASLIFAYRNLGHLIANLDPLGDNRTSHPDLELDRFGLTQADLDRVFDTGHLKGPKRATLREIIEILRGTYCGTLAVEYIHIQDVNLRRWLQRAMEPTRNRPGFSREKKMAILRSLTDAELFETFMHTRYPGQKRFSLEGAESIIAALRAIVELSPELGISELVMSMAHRGRLNVLANVLQKSYPAIFAEFDDNFPPGSVAGDGDVRYHKGYSSDAITESGRLIHLTLTANPSHLEVVGPVTLGRTRAKQRQCDDTEGRRKVIPLLIHGDAAFVGQGLVAETLNLSRLTGYKTGGTIHIIINNQIGFTTLPNEARSTRYVTDAMKMLDAPIFHVNGDDPEAVVHAAEMALRFRQEFGRDVALDVVCYRRHGHNEGDEPALTQPIMYKRIQNHPSTRRIYAQSLVERGELKEEDSARLAKEFESRLLEAAEEVKRAAGAEPLAPSFEVLWQGLREPYSDAPVKTNVTHGQLIEVARGLTTVPPGFSVNTKVGRLLAPRMKAIEERGEVDWPFAELLAFGTLLCEGVPVRLSGQDSVRGTFSQRHATWQDTETQAPHTPLNAIRPEGLQAKFCVYNSPLSEAAVLGFEYGYSLSEPRMLILWEAQFGDFANGAQVIVDQFLVSSESKWHRTSSLVMLLPHGYEGQGPEHSNAYLERYLMGCAENNIQVCNLTTPAQYFHALRRQMRRPFRRPLIVMAPKSLLRHKKAVSPVDALIEGRFEEVIDDPAVPDALSPERVRRIVFCSGKLYYDLIDYREKNAIGDSAVVRVEQFYPYPEAAMRAIAARYPAAQEVVWTQEEPQNRGGWTFMLPRLLDLFGSARLRYGGRPPSASPAVASLRMHKIEQEWVVRQTFGGPEGEWRVPFWTPSRRPAQ